MKRYILAGLVLALVTTVVVVVASPELQAVALLGAALGGTLGLVPDRSPAQRVGGFAVGFAAAWLGYALRAAVLPDATSGRAVAVLLVLLVCLAVAAGTRGRLPLWSTLLGAAAMTGAYEATYAADPTAFVGSSSDAPRRRSCSPPAPASWPPRCSDRRSSRSASVERAREAELEQPSEPVVVEEPAPAPTRRSMPATVSYDPQPEA